MRGPHWFSGLSTLGVRAVAVVMAMLVPFAVQFSP